MGIEQVSKYSKRIKPVLIAGFNYTEFGIIRNERHINHLSKCLTLIVLCFLVLSSSQLTKAQNFKIDSLIILNPENNEVRLKLPLLVGDKEISDIVNQEIISSLFFDTIIPPLKKNIEALLTDESKFGIWYEVINYEVVLLNEKIYSVSLSGEGCGAFCDSFYFSFMFDLETGVRIWSSDLFTTDGYDYFWERVVMSKNTKLENEIKTLLEETIDISSSYELNTHNRTINLYASCLESYSEAPSGYVSVNDKNLYVRIDKCSNHSNRDIDDLGAFNFYFPLNEIEKHLSPYGKKLLLN